MSIAAVRNLILPLVACPVIFDDPNAPRPPKPFVTLGIQALRGAADLIHGEVDEEGNLALYEHQRLSVEVNAYGADGFGIVERLRLQLRSPTTTDRASNLNIGITTVADAIDLTEMLNLAQNESRGVLEFACHMTGSMVDPVGLIEHAEIDCFDHEHVVPPLP